MADFLQKIRQLTAARVEQLNLTQLRNEAAAAAQPLPFVLDKKQNPFSIIAEIKFASPAAGVIREHITPEAIAADYLANGARALSILTEPCYFNGDITFIQNIRTLFPEVPLLMKDFIISEQQLLQARVYGASAVLLMMSLLSEAEMHHLYQLALNLGLTPLIEVHTVDELSKVLTLNPTMMVVNNRNLHDLSIDLAVSKKLIAQIPTHITAISASGFTHGRALAAVKDLGFAGFLIGSHLMGTESPGQTLQQLLQEAKAPRIKICGITQLSDAMLAATLGAFAIGFNFYEKSSRMISVAAAAHIISQLPKHILTVGIFIDKSLAQMQSIKQQLGLDLIQVYQPYPQATPAMKRSMILSVKPDCLADLPSINELQDYALVLIDSPPDEKGHYGGTGKLADWKIARHLTQYTPLILAGGLHENNVKSAMTTVNPFAIDVCSGVETTPGIKDPVKLIKLLRGEIMQSLPSYFGPYGGCFAAETLMAPLQELEQAYLHFHQQPDFKTELNDLLKNFVGRETPLYHAKRLTAQLGGAAIYLKREDLTHTGAHKINNSLGQGLLAKRMGKTRLVAETGAGQHGVATATVAALLGLSCTVYMGAIDMERQQLNVQRMRLLGAEVCAVNSGSQTLKDAVSAAMRDYVTHVNNTFFVMGSALGPHPYPTIVRDFQKVIGVEARRQILTDAQRLPDELVACIGGGSNSLGLFSAFLDDTTVKMTGVEGGGQGIFPEQHAARFAGGSLGVFQGTKTYLLQDEFGQTQKTHSISAGLDYPAVGPEHALLYATKRVNYTYATDEEALAAARMLARFEGIIPALESAHALAYAIKAAPGLHQEYIMLVNLSGRGDKDLEAFA